MSPGPPKEDLQAALLAAGAAHHEYETNFLAGERDEQWPGWYAAYVLGRLGDFAAPTRLASWLQAASGGGVWAEVAAAVVVDELDRTKGC